MAKQAPRQGDIIHLQFDPATGREMKGDHYALVISPHAFNKLGLAFVCPISQGAADVQRSHGFIVTLMGTGTDTQGCVHCHQAKSLDWGARKARRKERVPDSVLDEVLARVSTLLERET